MDWCWQRKKGWASRLIGLLMCLCGPMAPVHAASDPAEWKAYAGYVGMTLQQYLARDNQPAVQRFHAFLDQQEQDGRRVPLALVIRVWLDAHGEIIRLVAPNLGNRQAEMDLQQALTEQSLGRVPPAGMPMPLIMRLHLTYKE